MTEFIPDPSSFQALRDKVVVLTGTFPVLPFIPMKAPLISTPSTLSNPPPSQRAIFFPSHTLPPPRRRKRHRRRHRHPPLHARRARRLRRPQPSRRRGAGRFTRRRRALRPLRRHAVRGSVPAVQDGARHARPGRPCVFVRGDSGTGELV